jgi:hypothetical protein
MKERDETELVGYKIKPGSMTINISPLGKLTRNVCLKCLHPSDKIKYEITRKDLERHNILCDRCFRYLEPGKKDTIVYQHVVRKDLVAFFRKKTKKKKK